MTEPVPVLLTGLLALAVSLMFGGRRSVVRLRSVLYPGGRKQGARGRRPSHALRRALDSVTSRLTGARFGGKEAQDSMTLAVQQMAALLKGGRNSASLWEELMLVHARRGLSSASFHVIAAARGAAKLGSPVSAVIRNTAGGECFPNHSREQRVWFDVAACLDVADASGCPLADVLTRLAAQLDAEDDAEAARQTALAGPKSTATLLGWLPLTGLGLGTALGVDPMAVLIGTPAGLTALLAGSALTIVGRMWSSRLVRSAMTGLG